ncbi:MAG TPA: PBP1A family penicillin-binding protein [Nitrospiraceae bacterium]|nr:PBP1A family penicillin-binding protein [Nitrospiraceae bacterium]
MDLIRRWVRRSVIAGIVLVVVVLLAAVSYGLYLSSFISLPKGDEHPPLLLYGAPFLIKPDLALVESHLVERLTRLGYREVSGPVQAPGEFQVAPEGIDIFLHGFPDMHMNAAPIRVRHEQGIVRDVVSIEHGDPVFPAYLEPELISGMRGESRQVREWVPLADIPARLVDVLLSIEDRRFYRHFGIDLVAVGRAVWTNFGRGMVVQGGSTITQQLAKNLFYSPHRTWTRKVKESVAAVVMETMYSKTGILESYLNEIYLGQVGSVSVYGVREAAHRYFGKRLDELSIEDMALLVGMIKGPNTYSPLKNLPLAKQRRDVVLARLRDIGALSEAEWAKAVRAPVQAAPVQDTLTDAPFFVDYLLRQTEELTGTPLPDGVKVYTTLDPVLQRIASQTVMSGLEKLEAAYPFLTEGPDRVQAALVAMDPTTGGILAMVGGRDYRTSQFNRAVQARRQPGSLFKPIVYLAAFEARRDIGKGPPVTPSSVVMDEPMTFESGGETWAPQNYDKQFHGPVTVRKALEQSLNVPAVRLAQTVGLKRIRRLAHDLGIRVPLEDNLSIALGSSAVSLLEMTSAFGALANGGLAIPPGPLQSVASAEGDPLWHTTPERRQAVSPQAAYLATSLMKGVVSRGTAAKAALLGLRGVVAGKTGTTDSYRDAWFIGYTPDLVIGLWVGFDDQRPIRLSGAQAALPIWVDVARQVIPAESRDFPVPQGIVRIDIDPQTGQLATSKCPERVAEVFIEGTEPSVYCEVHGSSLWERLKRTFGIS